MKSAVCTLFVRDFHFGVGALVNSLYRHGFRGIVWAGYSGKLPPWADPIKKRDGYEEFEAAKGCVIRFIRLTTKIHYCCYKPQFILDIMEKYCPEADALFYFDPDIIVKTQWSFFESWVDKGVCLCEDVQSYMPPDHPIRLEWKKFAEKRGYKVKKQLWQFFNSGFIGIKKKYRNTMVIWNELTKNLTKKGISLNTKAIGGKLTLFHWMDQSTLNMALMITKDPISTVGREGMTFEHGLTEVMYHSIGKQKPWQKYIFVPKNATENLRYNSYWWFSQSPINVYNKQKLLLYKKEIGLFISSILTKIRRRK